MREGSSWLDEVAAFVKTKPLGAMGGVVVLVLAVAALTADWISPYDPLAFHYARLLSPPGPEFLLGTDNFGRDVLSRIIWGARTSLYVGVTAVLLGQLGGGVWGLASAYVGGRVDMISQRLVDVVMVFPSLVLALAIVAALGSSMTNVIVAIAVGQSPGAIRTMRAAALAVRQSSYAEAARAIGCRDVRIVFRHIFPNCLAPLLILASAALGSAILTEASLSFLGLGAPPPSPSWGGMMSGDGRIYMTQAPWIAVFPGLAVTLVVFGFNLFGDALRDALDPRLRRR